MELTRESFPAHGKSCRGRKREAAADSGLSQDPAAASALDRVVRRGPGRYLVVAHGGVLNATLRCVVGIPPPAKDQGVWFRFGDAGYVATSYDPTRHRWVIRELRT